MAESSPDSEWLRQIQKVLRTNQELYSSASLATQFQELIRRNRELYSTPSVAQHVQEILRRNQELFSSQNFAQQLQETMRRNQELLSSQVFREQLMAVMRENSAALRDAFGDVNGLEENDLAVPDEAAGSVAWVEWMLALSPIARLAVLNLMFGLLQALLAQAQASGAEISPAISASIGTVMAVINIIVGLGTPEDE